MDIVIRKYQYNDIEFFKYIIKRMLWYNKRE